MMPFKLERQMTKQEQFAKRCDHLRRAIASLLMALKREIVSGEDAQLVTIGADNLTDGWSYHTGDDKSFTGGANEYRHQSVVKLNLRSNCRDLADDAVEQLAYAMAIENREVAL